MKRGGLEISIELLYENMDDVYPAHNMAFEWELQLAKSAGDDEWVTKRIKLIPNWLECDDDMSEAEKDHCKAIWVKYAL